MSLGHDPEGKTLSILGMGGIRGALAKRAKVFEMGAVYYNRRELSPESNPADAKWVTLKELLRSSDVISVYLPSVRAPGISLAERILR